MPSHQTSVDEKPPEELSNQLPQKNSQTNETPNGTQASDSEVVTTPTTAEPIQETEESPQPTEQPNFDPTFDAEFEDNFEFKLENEESPTEIEVPVAVETLNAEKPKLTEKELKVLRLELENAEYLQLKSLLQAKINSEQFEIVKLRSHVALKNKQEGNSEKGVKDAKDNTAEEPDLRQRLMKENSTLEQKRLTLINQIFQERVACVQLKIELAMKEILSKS